jgi:NADH-ubiquinone oxidoreductase chain 4
MPLFAILFFVFSIFNAGAPLSLNFIGEFLALTGTFQNSPVVGFLGASGIFLSAIYSIWLFNRVTFLNYSPFFNQPIIKNTSPGTKLELGDLNRIEFFLIIPLLVATLAFGIWPNTILESLHYPVTQLLVNIDGSEFTRYVFYITNEINEFDALASINQLPIIE